ncbi:MAG: TIGR00266 family protein [Nitrospirae bacterium]|uniref:TIGR00266 family protein n=1 Tax=Candidatus Magnetobacterium casense TaxID=1455061 RepID=UPI0006988D05|nr:TIGR00266 family protein [Candidatus Magnetobacterium casensis]MBF0336732.1 TIGR00266 family protein [Nitrospirota bacterium]
MPEFQVVGNVDPFLLITLKKGERIYAESNAMVTMDAVLELKGKMAGGFFSSLARKFTSGESFFQQSLEATHGEGQALLSPTLPGDIEILDVGVNQYRLNDGAFVAASDTVQISVKSQGIGQALFGGTGGFFIMETSGQGKLAVSGFGTMFGLDVKAGSDVIVDNFHVVAWDRNLNYNISLSTSKGGFLSNLVGSVTTGEGVVNRFSGNGKVYVCSRNRSGFLGWIASSLPTAGSSRGSGSNINISRDLL